MVSEDGARHWLCPEADCGKQFNRPGKLKAHVLSHRDIKPFKCSHKDCSWAFTSNFKLQRHIQSHKKIKDFECSLDGTNLLD